MTMERLPEGGIENAESDSRPDPARLHMEPDLNPIVGYTTKELIARMEGKLDAYAQRQDVINENVTRLVPQVEDHEHRIKALEIDKLARQAVNTWQGRFWKVVAAVVATGGVAFGAIRHIHF